MSAAAFTPLGVRLTPYIRHYPHPPQEAFLWLNCKEALYGGAAGGGKSDALLMAALQYVDIPDYSALLVRRTFPQLGGSSGLIPRSHKWLAGTDAVWNEQRKAWHFPSGARLQFGFLQTQNDKVQYQGLEYQFVGFDELTDFDEDDYTYLATRLRRPSDQDVLLSQVPVRLRAASNPGGRGHRWVKQRFIDLPHQECAFIPAKLSDNPSIDQDSYVEQFDLVDPQTRAQLLEGDWNARPPGPWVYDQHGIDAAEALGAEFDALRLAGELPPPADQEIVLGIDWGIGETHSIVAYPMANGTIYVLPGEVVKSRGEPAELTREMLESAAVYDWPLLEARYDSAGAQQMKTFAANSPADVGLWKVDFNKHKQRTVTYLRRLFRRTAAGETSQVIAISPQNDVLLEQLRGLEFADQETGRIRKENDHGPDALLAAAAPIAARYAQEELSSASSQF